MAQRIVDPLFTSGLEYAMSVAGGENVPSMIAPGVGYSEEFPMGYTMEGGVPSAVAPPPPSAACPLVFVDAVDGLDACAPTVVAEAAAWPSPEAF